MQGRQGQVCEVWHARNAPSIGVRAASPDVRPADRQLLGGLAMLIVLAVAIIAWAVTAVSTAAISGIRLA